MSFVAAARILGVSASAVGKSVAKLEKELGVRLFQRSTRSLSLTVEGELFFERCRRILDDLEDAQTLVSRAAHSPRGKLRISLPTIGYRFLLPHIAEFRRGYPEVELDLDFNDQLVDVIDEGFDLVIRSGDLPDSNLVSRRLGAFRFLVCAAPAYLATHGIPTSPAALVDHDCLRFRFPTSGKRMPWTLSPEPAPARLPSMLTCNNMEALLAATVDAQGIAYMPDFLVRSALQDGRLRRVLEPYANERGQFWALWPSSRHLSPKIRAFVDFMAPRLFSATPAAADANLDESVAASGLNAASTPVSSRTPAHARSPRRAPTR